MKTFFRNCSISLFFLLGATLAQGNDRDENRLRRDIRSEQRNQQQEQQQQRQQNRYETRQQQQEMAPSSDATRRGGRMSPDERRALRRQIDEANHDITIKKR